MHIGWRPDIDILEVTDRGICHTWGHALGAKNVEAVAWQDVSKIEVETTNAGPAAEDMFFWIHGVDGKGTVVPNSLASQHNLVKEFQARFPNFDNRALAGASGCSANCHFLLWEKATLE
jgi:hypothetical protein